jgi:hypothetical protein
MSKHIKLFQPTLAEREAAATMAGHRVVPLWDMKGKWVGSATAVRIGHTAFLFTAAHLISAGDPVQVLQPSGVRPIVEFRRRVCDDSGSDLAFLELSPEGAAKLPHYVEVSEIIADYDVQFGWPVVVAGCSESEYIRIAPNILGAMSSVTSAQVVPFSEWPSDWPSSDHGPPTAIRDILVAYPKESHRKLVNMHKPADGAKLQKKDSPSPCGLSGGGIWLELHHERESTGLRYPDIKLIGIQVAFSRRHRLCRCNRIGPLLRLIAKNYPELRPKIRGILRRRPTRVAPEKAG